MRGWWICLAAAACYQPKPRIGAACGANDACPAELACIGGLCLSPGTLPPDGPVQPPADAPPDSPPGLDAPPPDPSLIARWTFETDPSAGAHDVTGHGHDAACVTTCPTLVAGKAGNGYRFDAAKSEALRTPDSLAFRGNYTIAAWIKIDAVPTTNSFSIMAKPLGTGTANSWQLEVLSDDKLSHSAGTPHTLEGSTAITINAWHHVAGTWDGTTKYVYVDGVQVGSVAATDDFDTHAVYLGSDENNGAPALFFSGVLDDLRIYNRALTTPEIATLAGP